MKLYKRLLACVLAVVMTFSVFCGCRDKGKKNSETVTTTNTATTSENDSIEISPAEITEFCFSRQSGFYDEDFVLMLYHPDQDAKIYYTTDGSVPDENSTLYTNEGIALTNKTSEKNVLAAQRDTTAGDYYKVPEGITKGNVIRAVAVLSDGTTEEIYGTYFVGVDREEEYGDVPVISLITDTDNLFNYQTGIYVTGITHDEWLAENNYNQWLEAWQHKGNYSNRGKEWERDVCVEYLNADGSTGFSQNMGLRIMGGASRNNNQKSLRLIAREEYGKKNVKYPIIPDNEKSDGNGEVEKYKSFVLRDGGNDCDYAKIRDPLLQQLVSDRNFETMQFTPVVVFIDGEYWGMYSLVEDYNDNYIQNNYDGIEKENVVMIKNGAIEEGEDDDKALFDQMYNFITSNDMSNDENYEKASQMLDMQSFIDYVAFNLYIYNQDSFFECNNWRMWRVREAVEGVKNADGKWRLMAFDNDYSTGIYDGGTNNGSNNIAVAISKGNQGNYPAKLLPKLLENGNFKRDLIRTMCDLRNVNFEKTSVNAQIDELMETYGKLVPDTFRRFGPQWVADQWSIEEYYTGKVEELRTFLNGRYDKYIGIMKKAFSLLDAYNVTIKSENSTGKVILNGQTEISLDKEFSGEYFGEYGLTVTAVSDEKTFVKWEVEGCEISDPTSQTAEITLTGDCTITAIFE